MCCIPRLQNKGLMTSDSNPTALPTLFTMASQRQPGRAFTGIVIPVGVENYCVTGNVSNIINRHSGQAQGYGTLLGNITKRSSRRRRGDFGP